MSNDQHSPSTPSADQGYDRQELFLPGVIGAGVTLLLFLVASGFVIRSYFARASFHEEERKIAQVTTTDWNNLKEASGKQLASYGWNDAKAGTVHIPIARAMELVIADAKNPPATDKKAVEKKAVDKKAVDNKATEKKTSVKKPDDKVKAKK